MSAQDANTVRRLIQELWNNKSLSIAEQILTSDSRNIDPNTPDFGAGPDAYKKLVTMYTNAFPDLRLTIDELIAEGDKIVLRWTASGTHKGELRGIPPTGKKMEITGTTICRLSNGKIAEQWVAWNALGLLQQLGVIPATENIGRRAA